MSDGKTIKQSYATLHSRSLGCIHRVVGGRHNETNGNIQRIGSWSWYVACLYGNGNIYYTMNGGTRTMPTHTEDTQAHTNHYTNPQSNQLRLLLIQQSNAKCQPRRGESN